MLTVYKRQNARKKDTTDGNVLLRMRWLNMVLCEIGVGKERFELRFCAESVLV